MKHWLKLMQYRLEAWLFADQFAMGYLWAHSLLKRGLHSEEIGRLAAVRRNAFTDGVWESVADNDK